MKVTEEIALQVGSVLGIDFNKISLKTFIDGLNVELEHGSTNPLTNVTNDDLILTGKIALAHLLEAPDYYERLEIMENEANKAWKQYSDKEKYNMIMKDNNNNNSDNKVTYSLLAVTVLYFLSLIK